MKEDETPDDPLRPPIREAPKSVARGYDAPARQEGTTGGEHAPRNGIPDGGIAVARGRAPGPSGLVIAEPLDTPAFRRSLRNGTGRAMLMLMASGGTPALRDLLLEACLVNEVYDRQCEESRENFLHQLIAASGDAAFFHAALWRQLREAQAGPGAYETVKQRLGLAQIFAILCLMADGQDEAARRDLRAWFDASPEELGDLCLWSLVQLDGLPGLLRCLPRIAPGILADFDERGWLFRSLADALRERDGEAAADAALLAARREVPALDRLMALDEAWQPAAPSPARKDYATFRRQLDETGRASGGRHFTTAELAMAARDLMAERDAKRLRAYLLVFCRRPFPLPPDGLLPLLGHADPHVARAAAMVLGGMADERVRQAALAMLQQGRATNAIRLLRTNYRRGDAAAIGRALDAAVDDDAFHALGFALIDVARNDAAAAADAAPLLLRLYEEGRCSVCRGSAATLLAGAGAMPDWMARELPFDVGGGLAEAVASSSPAA